MADVHFSSFIGGKSQKYVFGDISVSALPPFKGLGPSKKISKKKYIIIYYITKSTFNTETQNASHCAVGGPTLSEAIWSRTQEKQLGNKSGVLCVFLVG